MSFEIRIIVGERQHNSDLRYQAGRDLYRVITAVTRDLGLHSSIQSKHSVMS